MAQPLTLNEIGVAEADAAQVIYDLRRENRRLRTHVPEIAPDKRTTPLGCAAHDEWVRWPCSEWERAEGTGDFKRCTPDLLRRYPTICSDQPFGDWRRRVVGQRSDGTCDYHEHWIERAGSGPIREGRDG